MIDRDAGVERRSSTPAGEFAGATSLTSVGVTIAVVAVLHYGQEVLVPVALAMLLSFALTPLVNRLRAWRVPRVPAVLVTVALAFVVISVFSVVVSRQVVSLAGHIPTYQRNIEVKIRALRGKPGDGLIERTAEAVKDIQADLNPAPPGEPRREPVPVRIEGSEPSPTEVVLGLVGPALGPLATGGVMIVLAIFMLLEKEDLRDRLIRLVGTRDLHRTTQALNEAGARVSRYLLAQLVVNATYGVAIGFGLFVIGVPGAVLWGLLATVLRFIPYVGPILAAAFPLALSVAVAPEWAPLAWTAALFIVIELISNNVVEPWLYGASTGVSTVAIVFAAVFWTWVWGPVGLLLSTPLTVCLVVLGRYVPQMRPFNIMFGSEPALTAAERFYQRLLADDTDEALDIAEDTLAERPLAELCDEVILPALRLADGDRRRGVLEPARVTAIASAIRHIVSLLSDPAAEAPEPAASGRVLCLAARTDLDAVTAMLLASLLRAAGHTAEVLEPREALGFAPEGEPVSLICLCLLQTSTRPQAERLWRRFARHLPAAPVVLALWDERAPNGEAVTAATFKAVLGEVEGLGLEAVSRKEISL